MGYRSQAARPVRLSAEKAEEALPAVGAFVDGVLAAGPGGGDRERAGLVLVAAPERGLAAPVTAVPPAAGGGEADLADGAGDRPGIVLRRRCCLGWLGHGVPSPERSLPARARWARIR